jgi:hypothetical protein
LLLTPVLLKAQNQNVGIGTNTPDPSAVLDITSNSKGVLIPRLSAAQRMAINTPAPGLLVYDTDSFCLFYYNKFVWTSLCDPNTASNGVTKIRMPDGKNDYELGSPLTRYTDIPLAGHTLTFSTTTTGGNVGIGNAHPHASAILDLNNDNNKGFLVPKMTLTSTAIAAPVNNPTVGLLVFNTNIVNDVFPGFYFWDGNVWVRLYSSNLPAVSKILVTAPVTNTGTDTNPIIGVTTGDLIGSSVVSITNGSGRVTGGNSKVDVVGASGSVLYGTGGSSAFSVPGTPGFLLQSNGSNAPSWVDPASLITASDLTGSNVITVTNGTGKVLGASGASVDVSGPAGSVLYGTGTSSSFTSQGAPGQFLQSSGTGAPVWASISNTTSDLVGSSTVTVSNGTGKVYGVGNANVDVAGTAGGLLYGTGASSAFTGSGLPGQFLQANGAGAPLWTSSSDVIGSSTVNVTNGSGQIVGGTNMNVDVVGGAGTVLYGTGTSSAFTPQGQPGFILQSNGAAPPTWVMPSAVVASSDLTGSSVVQITSGNNRVVGLGGASVDVVGTTIGSVLYGTGASSAFTAAGTSGQYLKSNGAAAPTWSNGNDVTGSTVVSVTNGTGQVLGASPMSVDVKGTAGGVLYGTGTSSDFTPAGLAGQVLLSNGVGAPSWGNLSANNGVHVTTPNVQLGGQLVFDTDIPLNGKKMTFSGSTGNVGIGTTSPVSSAILDLSTTTKTFAPPRMTSAQRDAIASPVAGEVIYNSTCDEINYYSNLGYWRSIAAHGSPTALNSTNITTSSFQANWTAVQGCSGYVVDVATDVNFTVFVAGWNANNVGNVTSTVVSGLTNCVNYYYRVRAVFCSGPGDNSNTITAAPHSSGTQTFTYTGSNQTFTVPCGVYSMNVQLWGAGGACGYWGHGGGGGYASGTVAVTPGQTLTLIVGQGGQNNPPAPAYGGGGTGQNSSQWSGGGGGRSAIQFVAGTDIITAGGGGGGGAYWYSYTGGGGGGGGTTGGDGVDGYYNFGGAGAGKGGTQAAGGAGGTGTANGAAGTAYTGGAGGNAYYAGGGGGGGWYGGGGGAGNSSCCAPGNFGGGGGGSSYISNAAVTNGMTLSGASNNQYNGTPCASGGAAQPGYINGVGVGPILYYYNYVRGTAGNGEIILTW